MIQFLTQAETHCLRAWAGEVWAPSLKMVRCLHRLSHAPSADSLGPQAASAQLGAVLLWQVEGRWVMWMWAKWLHSVRKQSCALCHVGDRSSSPGNTKTERTEGLYGTASVLSVQVTTYWLVGHRSLFSHSCGHWKFVVKWLESILLCHASRCLVFCLSLHYFLMISQWFPMSSHKDSCNMEPGHVAVQCDLMLTQSYPQRPHSKLRSRSQMQGVGGHSWCAVQDTTVKQRPRASPCVFLWEFQFQVSQRS